MAGRCPASGVERAGRQSGRRAARRADAAVGRPRRAIVPGRSNDERVERGGSRGRERKRAVDERSKRLDDADERHARRVVRIPVLVRVDGQLEPRENLVRSAVDRDAAGRVRLPARDADREQRGARRGPFEVGRAVGADDEPRHLRSVAFRSARRRRVLARAPIATGVEDVEAGQERPPDVRVHEIDARVEQRNRDTRAREARELNVGAAGPTARKQLIDGAWRDCGRQGGTDGVHAPHIGRPDDDRERARVERSCEAVEYAVERRARARSAHLSGRGRSGPSAVPGARSASSPAPAPRSRRHRLWQRGSRARADRERRSTVLRAVARAGLRAGSPSRPHPWPARPRPPRRHPRAA